MTAAHSGLLKVELALDGVELATAAKSRPELQNTAHPEQPRAVELLLPDDLVVDAPILNGDGGATQALPYRLECDAEHFFLHRGEAGGDRVEVRVIPPPRFYEERTGQGTPMRQIGTVFGSFLALSPIEPCGLSLWRRVCRWCADAGAPAHPPRAVSEVVETVRAAFAEGAVEFILFNGGLADTEDGGVAALEPYISAVKRHFDTLVAVQLHPPRSNRWIDRTYAMGVDAISYSVEVHDPTLLARLCPHRVERIGQERYYEALAHAATIFPSGTVWSDLIAGIEAPASTIAGIDHLVGAGVLPVLSLARPSAGAAVHDRAARPADLGPILAHLFQAVREAKINMGWVQELSFGITPLEARFFAGDDARLSVAQHFYRSRLGSLTARNLARLRRRLRVRTVSDSFDSSHL